MISVRLIFGMPGEGLDDQRASLALAAELADLGTRIHAHTFRPGQGGSRGAGGAGSRPSSGCCRPAGVPSHMVDGPGHI